MINDADINDPELIECVREIENNYSIFKRYKKPNIRPAVGFFLTKGFNESVKLDLKEYYHVTL